MADREILEVDVLIVGAGPAGLACAIHLGEQARRRGLPKLNVLVIEKGACLGAHILSGAVLDARVLDELVQNWRQKGAPVRQPVSSEELLFLSEAKSRRIPHSLVPQYLDNRGNYVISLCELVRWLAEQAKERGAEILEGVAGSEVLLRGNTVTGVRCSASGLGKDGQPKPNFQPGVEVRAKVTVLAEGSHGNLAKQLVAVQSLDINRQPQTYSLALKELWELPAGTFRAGRIVHTLGFPLQKLLERRAAHCFGGGFLYGLDDTHLAVGLVVGLDYTDPSFDPHAAFNRWKGHPFVRTLLEKGELIQHGAKSVAEGGYYSMPRFYTDGCCLVGDCAGFVNEARGKGIHLAMKSGMLAAEAIAAALDTAGANSRRGKRTEEGEESGDGGASFLTSHSSLGLYEDLFQISWARSELYAVRNWRAGFARGLIRGAVHDLGQRLSGGRGFRDPLPLDPPQQTLTPHHQGPGQPTATAAPPPAPSRGGEGVGGGLTLDKATAVFHSGTQHQEDQPCHLKVLDLQICVWLCAVEYGQPCQHFCPAGVYEWEQQKTGPALRINAANCLHCKACDVKDPYENILWTVPEGGSGPRYQRM